MAARRQHGDEGTVLLWILLLVVLLVLPIGMIGIGLWQAFSAQLALISAADAAAVAGASGGIDAGAYRQQGHETGVVQLDPALAERVARENLAAQTDLPGFVGADIDADTDHVTVVIRGRLSIGILNVFANGPLDVVAQATGRPSLLP